MKIAVIRPNSSGWIFAAGTESSWSLRLNRHNYAWWRKLVVQAHENYADGLVAAINATASLYDDAAWQQLEPGVELRRGIGRTHVGRPLISSTSPAAVTSTAHPGSRASRPAGQRAVMYWCGAARRCGGHLSQAGRRARRERYGPQWPERVPQLVTLRATIEQEATL
ncbi:MAG: hypothetical protein KatS3mg038_0820 [Candidatus Kapaibacterium sp.]|nr:MAG: hypothetical protein KatS3mg038_0820 [Candidatus Kapabacteria bacterium]